MRKIEFKTELHSIPVGYGNREQTMWRMTVSAEAVECLSSRVLPVVEIKTVRQVDDQELPMVTVRQYRTPEGEFLAEATDRHPMARKTRQQLAESLETRLQMHLQHCSYAFMSEPGKQIGTEPDSYYQKQRSEKMERMRMTTTTVEEVECLTARAMQVIETKSARSTGNAECPVRMVTQYWSLDGELLAESWDDAIYSIYAERGAADRLAGELKVDTKTVYARKDDALYRFTLAYFGAADL